MKISGLRRLVLAGLATAVLLSGGVELAAGIAQAQPTAGCHKHCGTTTTPPPK
jgi:hypothetical protein